MATVEDEIKKLRTEITVVKNILNSFKISNITKLLDIITNNNNGVKFIHYFIKDKDKIAEKEEENSGIEQQAEGDEEPSTTVNTKEVIPYDESIILNYKEFENARYEEFKKFLQEDYYNKLVEHLTTEIYDKLIEHINNKHEETVNTIVNAINDLGNNINQKITTLENRLDSVSQVANNAASTATNAWNKADNAQDGLSSLASSVFNLEGRVSALESSSGDNSAT